MSASLPNHLAVGFDAMEALIFAALESAGCDAIH
jgi:hypothetical protein